MNARALPPATVRTADLRDAGECARIIAFVEAQPDATPFHLPQWSIATAKGCGQVAQYLVADRGDAGIVGVLPLTEVHSPLFGRALVSTGFGVDGGILGEGDAALAQAAWRLAEQLSCPTLELRGGGDPGEGFVRNTASYVGFARDLAPDDDAELLAIPRKQRAEVRRALGFDLEVTIDADPRDHYTVYAQSVRNLGTPVFPASLFRAVLVAFGDAADILTVRHQGRAVASVLSLYWRGTVYPYWGGGTAEARALRANDRMYFALMGHARARGCTRFDFGRSKTGTGAAAFKKNWGFEAIPRTYYTRTADGSAPREINPLSPKYRLQVRAWSKLPLPIANRLGPWIARGLG
ncbi:FemAB family XrtA/PEP-CTERM system-associated protein [Sphingomonas qomolangmaensis]|uniref:FemAB family PEP-CTERM system-associated protein n=1 Tax=Sphingomonas qomolangmaensis TaxID=2918765 RepID=A0ABY5LC44_9SPHN|nr:FemAB family XrtA/PEP-CTERM system-associated protein [Sphingomonas qomolangmaensis]UUL83238.1 FemAB family PEP-CTERM system-associated protein [Sphingomonas qomolangmaensis]